MHITANVAYRFTATLADNILETSMSFERLNYEHFIRDKDVTGEDAIVGQPSGKRAGLICATF